MSDDTTFAKHKLHYEWAYWIDFSEREMQVVAEGRELGKVTFDNMYDVDAVVERLEVEARAGA